MSIFQQWFGQLISNKRWLEDFRTTSYHLDHAQCNQCFNSHPRSSIFQILILESHPCRVYYNMHIQDLFHKSKMTTKMKDVLDGMRSALDSIHQSLDLAVEVEEPSEPPAKRRIVEIPEPDEVLVEGARQQLSAPTSIRMGRLSTLLQSVPSKPGARRTFAQSWAPWPRVSAHLAWLRALRAPWPRHWGGRNTRWVINDWKWKRKRFENT